MTTETKPAQQTPESLYAAAAVQLHEVEDAAIAVRVFGQGPHLVFVHGYPVHGYTWRKILPALAKTFTCHVVDLPGLGSSEWNAETDFSFTAQARRLSLLFDSLILDNYAMVAHDTGATIARLVALLRPERVSHLALINTEMPGHRPPWIQFYQFSARLPLAPAVFRTLLSSKRFLRSSMALGQFYSDASLFDVPDNLTPYLEPLVTSPQRMRGMLGYLRGIEWPVVDGLRERHKEIKAEVMVLWGEEDKTFPVAIAEQMCGQFSHQCRFVRLRGSSLMPHEEDPGGVLEAMAPFLVSSS